MPPGLPPHIIAQLPPHIVAQLPPHIAAQMAQQYGHGLMANLLNAGNTPPPPLPGPVLARFTVRLGELGHNVSHMPVDGRDAFIQGLLQNDGSGQLVAELEQIQQEEAAEARRWRPVLRQNSELNAMRDEGLAMHRAGPNMRTTVLTVDNGDSNVCIGSSILNSFPNLESMDLKSGWHNWQDFQELPNNAPHLSTLRECSMTFQYHVGSVLGLEHHWRIFTHPALQTLKIYLNVDYADPNENSFLNKVPVSDVNRLGGLTALDSLTLVGIDVITISRALEMPRRLRHLSWDFDVWCPNDIKEKFMFDHTTDEWLRPAFRFLHDSLETLEFRHAHLTNYRWGNFSALQRLRVHEEHFFPYMGRVWGDLNLGDLVPMGLKKLEIRGCKFGKPMDVRDPAKYPDRLLASLDRLARELIERRDRSFAPTGIPTIKIMLDPESKRFPVETVEKYTKAGLQIQEVANFEDEHEDR